MTGVFAEKAVQFVNFKRSLGFRYKSEPKCLSRFCRFSSEQGVTSDEITRLMKATDQKKSRSM